MDDASSQEGSEDHPSYDQKDEEEDLELEELEKAIAEDFSNYECFIKPFHSPEDEEENVKKLQSSSFDQIERQQTRSGEKSSDDFHFQVGIAMFMLFVSSVGQ